MLGTLFLFIPLLSGCSKLDERERVLRDAEGYDIRGFEERQPEDPDAVKRLSVGASSGNAGQAEENQPEAQITEPKSPPPMQIDQEKKYTAVLKTAEGDITIELFAQNTPITVNNFVSLARDNFYNGTVFHRVIKDFMIQGGDPKGDGTGGPGYKFDDEPFEGEYKRGTVAMANSGPDTNGSQFFIVHQDYDLSKNYVIFGKVIQGMETVDKIAEAEVADNGSGEQSKPVNPVKIQSMEIRGE